MNRIYWPSSIIYSNLRPDKREFNGFQLVVTSANLRQNFGFSKSGPHCKTPLVRPVAQSIQRINQRFPKSMKVSTNPWICRTNEASPQTGRSKPLYNATCIGKKDLSALSQVNQVTGYPSDP